MPERNMVSFVTLIQGFSQSEKYIEAVELFVRLHREGHGLNSFVFTTILKVLVSMEWSEFAWCAHACICKLGHDANAFVGTALIDAYSVCGISSIFFWTDGRYFLQAEQQLNSSWILMRAGNLGVPTTSELLNGVLTPGSRIGIDPVQ
ncbi:unnamed protein product [Fraxinus pennsylvanica]|uniref:Pentatricopeptide repeat-containing protein n=1 Tax=Fraxinus pennsylvanica TaxID=56036 RepID=A0AAD1ZWQ1_9LAMI|nr:unnamed protein product [Fraxinus pennsylvanica]